MQLPEEVRWEISSPSTWKRDKNEKLRLYLKAGVREYWIVNLELEVVEVYRFQTDPDNFPRSASSTISKSPCNRSSPDKKSRKPHAAPDFLFPQPNLYVIPYPPFG
jgi:hypothetical protein